MGNHTTTFIKGINDDTQFTDVKKENSEEP